jgi:hypothetical protein
MAYNATQIPTGMYTATPSDTVAQPGFGFRVYTTAGDVAFIGENGVSAIAHNVQVGETVTVCFSKILSQGTTAVGIDVYGPS